MTPMNVLPPVPAVWGDDWEDEWQRRLDDQRAVGADLAARVDRHGAYWDHGSVRLGGTDVGLRADPDAR